MQSRGFNDVLGGAGRGRRAVLSAPDCVCDLAGPAGALSALRRRPPPRPFLHGRQDGTGRTSPLKRDYSGASIGGNQALGRNLPISFASVMAERLSFANRM